MNVFYEEEGSFKAGTVLADNEASLQVEAPHGKRSKIKASNVLLRFTAPAPAALLAAAEAAAAAIDADFLWQCCGAEEFSFETLGRDYYGHAPDATEAAALLFKLHGAPMYFYKKGKGRYKAAPAESLKAALASVEKKRLQAEQKQAYIDALCASRLPEAFRPQIDTLLYAPDRNSLEWKALETACSELNLTPAQLFERCGALASSHDFHLKRFLFEHFPRGSAWGELPALRDITAIDLPLAAVTAFSIDDASTTEIDDAFSVTPLPNGHTRIGIHIAAPALGVEPGAAVDIQARMRLSTVYFPGAKITMLPPAAIEMFTLAAGAARPALSLYAEISADNTVVATESRCERVPISANLRLGELEAVFNLDTLANGVIEHEYGAALERLWRFATQLEALRGKAGQEIEQRPEYNFEIQDDQVRIIPRQRGTPLDKVVSELMIYANSEWGRQLAAATIPAVYRVQSGGVARMTTAPGPHEGLGVAQYAWASSPLRRYMDLINQRQLLALVGGTPTPYVARDEALLMAVHDFELTYDAYAEFQRGMERYWCLRWLQQEHIIHITAKVIRDNLVRLDGLPLVLRVPSLREVAAGDNVRLALSKMDLWELSLHAEFEGKIPAN